MSINDLFNSYSVGAHLAEGQTIRAVCNAFWLSCPLDQASEDDLRRLSNMPPDFEYRLIVTDDYIVYHHDVALTRFLKEQLARHSPVPIDMLLELVDTDPKSQWWSRDTFQYADGFCHEHSFSGWFGEKTIPFYYYGIMLTPEHGIYYAQLPVLDNDSSRETFEQMKAALRSMK